MGTKEEFLATKLRTSDFREESASSRRELYLGSKGSHVNARAVGVRLGVTIPHRNLHASRQQLITLFTDLLEKLREEFHFD